MEVLHEGLSESPVVKSLGPLLSNDSEMAKSQVGPVVNIWDEEGLWWDGEGLVVLTVAESEGEWVNLLLDILALADEVAPVVSSADDVLVWVGSLQGVLELHKVIDWSSNKWHGWVDQGLSWLTEEVISVEVNLGKVEFPGVWCSGINVEDFVALVEGSLVIASKSDYRANISSILKLSLDSKHSVLNDSIVVKLVKGTHPE